MNFTLELENLGVLGGILILSIITTLSGIGGGGIFIPYLIFTKGFSLIESIPLAITIILADCIVRMLLLYKMPNPEKPNRYFMDLTPGNVIVPFDAIFSWVGIFLLKSLPKIITIIIVIILVLISLVKIIKTTLRECSRKPLDNELPDIDGIEIFYKQPTEIIKKRDDRYINLLLIILSVSLVGIFGLRDNYKTCSLEYWLFILGNIISLSIFSVISGKYLIYQYNKRKTNNFPFISSDIVWNKKNISLLGLLASISGILSTWLGLGGSTLITPILYYFEMKPEVIGVSIGVSTLFSSLISLLNYIFSGNYLFDWGLALFITSSIGSLIGIFLLKFIIKYCKKGMISLLVIIVMIISVISLILNIVFSDDGLKLDFKNPCINE